MKTENKFYYGNMISSAQRNYNSGKYLFSYESLKRAYPIKPKNVKILVLSTCLYSKLNLKGFPEIHKKLGEMIDGILQNATETEFLVKSLSELGQKFELTHKVFYRVAEELIKNDQRARMAETLHSIISENANPGMIKNVVAWHKNKFPESVAFNKYLPCKKQQDGDYKISTSQLWGSTILENPINQITRNLVRGYKDI